MRKLRIAVLLLGIGLAVLTHTTAIAAVFPQDGTDPNTTGCSAPPGAFTAVGPIVVDQGNLELRYSNTPGCDTAWARFTCTQFGGCTDYDIMVIRWQDGATQGNGARWPSRTPNGAILYTLQLFDGWGWTASACYRSAIGGWVWVCTGAF
jgi:hypothetical protein